MIENSDGSNPISSKVKNNLLFHQQFMLQQSQRYFPKGKWIPPTDVYETEGEYVIKLELAGVKFEDVDVSYKGNKITIKGKREGSLMPNACSCHQIEISYGAFERSVILPDSIPEDSITADYDNAFLTITIKKDRSTKQPTQLKLKKK